MKKILLVLLLILILLSGIYLLKEKKPSGETPTSNQLSNISTWKIYKHPILDFSVRYPSDILFPDFNDIDPNSLANKDNIHAPDIDLYMNNIYKAKGFDNLGELNAGFLRFKPESYFVNQKYVGINFAVYYFDKDIKFLSKTFGSNKDFYFSKLNGVTVGVMDHTKKSDGTPLSYAKFYFIKNKTDLLQIATFIPESVGRNDSNKVLELFENVVKTISFEKTFKDK